MFQIENSISFWQGYFTHSANPMWVYDCDSLQFLAVNESAIQLYGYTTEEFLELTMHDILSPEELQRLISISIYDTEEDKKDSFSQHIKKDKTMLWVKLAHINIVYENKRAKLVTAIDFTSTKIQKILLKEKNQELETLSLVARYTNNLVLITDDTGKISWVNNAFNNIMQYSPEEVIGKKPSEFIHGPLTDLRTSQHIKEAIKNQQPFKEEIIHYTKNNLPIWILADGQPVFDQYKKLIKYVIVEADITAQKQQQEKLNRSESDLNSFFNSSGSILVLFDNDFKVLAFNKKAQLIIYEILNTSIQIGGSVFSMIPSPSIETFRYFATEALAGRGTDNKETQFPGSDLWWNSRYLPLYDSFGVIIGASFSAIDITDKKKAESVLIENEQRYNLVTKATFDAIWDLDIGKNKLYRGEGFHTLFGHETGNLQNNSSLWNELIHKDDYEKVSKKFQQIVASDQSNWMEEYRYLKSDGQYSYVRDKAIIIRDSEGKATRIVGAMQDISQQILREKQLKLFESAIKNTSDAVVITDIGSENHSDVRIVFVNEAFTKMTGYSYEDVVGGSPRILQGPLTDRSELIRLKQAINNWTPCEIETVNYKKNSEPFWVNISIVPVAGDNGFFTHWIAIQKDITEKRKQVEERELMILELTKKNNELKQFSYITSHNLRAPLTNMIGILKLIDPNSFSNNRTKDLIEGLQVSTINLNETLNDLIKILIIKEAAQIKLEKIHLESKLNKVIQSIKQSVNESNTSLEYDFSEVEYVNFSRVYLESILLNLILNAIKYKSPERDPKIKIYSTISNGCTQLHITDNGLGMDWEKVKNKIFGLYQKFHNHKDSKGIGLYLVHAQVTALGGSISIKTELNKGSTFIITFKNENE